MASVTLSQVTKIYDESSSDQPPAVASMDLEVQDREFLVFVGPSGCGKSTTLRMIAGLESVSSGDILIGEKRVNDIPPKDRDIAMVFQSYALYPHMTVYDNMAFGLKLRKTKPAEINKRVQNAASILGIEDLLERRPKTLSGGQRQRVAVGRAIVRQPKVFLFDEPLSNLDAKMRTQMRTEITKLHQQLQTTMIYVTHDQVEAMTMGHRIVVMNHGVVQQIDEPQIVYREPTNLFVAGFLGSPPMNLIHGHIRRVKNRLTFQEIGDGTLTKVFDETETAFLEPWLEKPIILGVRPEDLEMAPADAKPGSADLQALVDLIEPMGAETVLYLQTGEHPAVCRVMEMLDQHGLGHRMQFNIKPDRLHLFDPETTNRLVRPPAS